MSRWDNIIGALNAWLKYPYISLSRRFQWTGFTKTPKPVEQSTEVPPEHQRVLTQQSWPIVPKERPVPEKKYPTPSAFLAAFKPYAQAVEAKYNVPWLLTATQAAHESGNGNSALAQAHNNLFGVTGDHTLKAAGVPETMAMVDVKAWLAQHPECPVVIMKTNEEHALPPEKIHYWARPGDILTKEPHGTGSDLLVERPFKTYVDWTASLQDWVERIVRLYPAALHAAMANDAAGFFDALQAGGYATDKKYALGLKARYAEMEALA
jgi:flagellum-specific peptidoglycan hydrolase FlgJ